MRLLIDKLEQHDETDTLLLSISENDIFFNQPDTNAESLHHLLTSMVGKSPDVVDNMLKAHRQGRVAKPTIIDSIFKDRAALSHYALLYSFEALHDENLWKPFQLLQWQPSASSVGFNYFVAYILILNLVP